MFSCFHFHGLNSGLTSNKPTQCLIGYGDFNSADGMYYAVMCYRYTVTFDILNLLLELENKFECLSPFAKISYS